MADSLRGTRLTTLESNRDDVELTAYSSGDKVGLFVSSRVAGDLDLTLDVSDLLAGRAYHHLWGSVLGVAAGASATDYDAIPHLQQLTRTQLSQGMAAGSVQIGLDKYETVRLVFTTSATGVTMNGREADDRLDGSGYNDLIVGAGGSDQLFGLAANDRVSGEAGNDALYGGAGDDTLTGGAGNDTLLGEAGADRLVGGIGNDLYHVTATSEDTLVEVAGEGTDTVSATATWTLGSTFENLLLAGSATISGTGNAVANSITGNGVSNTLMGLDGNDTLSGGSGNDTLLGGLGIDCLEGGAGSDAFVFTTLTRTGTSGEVIPGETGTTVADTITDFGRAAVGNDDVIRISAAGFGAGLQVGALATSQLQVRADNRAQDTDDRFVYRTTDGTLWFDGDGAGEAAAVLVARLGISPDITSTDILIF
jgi:Ca2+-binding RTX toxin-like protein